MIRTIIKSSLLVASLLLSGCGGDNAFDGTGLIGGGSTQEQGDALASIQENVLKVHANAFLEQIETLQNTINSFDTNITQSNVQTMQNSFKSMMQSWKSTEASYVVGDYDGNLKDSPQLIDFYRTGNKLDVSADIRKALNSSASLENALFKNSSRSITALEYLIFGDNTPLTEITNEMNKNNKRRVEAMKVALNSMKKHSTDIASFYQNDTRFVANSKDASNAIVNALIASAFKLKEWRIGDASGIAIKYRDRPNPNRFEYVKSRLSTEAIEAILKTHQDIMGERSYRNFGSFASENGAGEIVNALRVQISKALSLVAALKPIEDAITTSGFDPKIQQLYDTAKTIQVLYFDSLIQALELTAEIVEQDGD